MAFDYIPESDQEGLLALSELPEDIFNKFLEALQRAPLAMAPVELAKVIDSALGANAETYSVGQIVSTLISVFNVRYQMRLTNEELIDEITATLRNEERFEQAKVSMIEKRLLSLASSENAMFALAKAIGLMVDHANVFEACRIISDLRPVFGKDGNSKPLGMVLSHVLKLEYRDAGTSDHVYIALSNKHLQKLKDSITRAEEKSEQLKTLIGQLDLPLLTI